MVVAASDGEWLWPAAGAEEAGETEATGETSVAVAVAMLLCSLAFALSVDDARDDSEAPAANWIVSKLLSATAGGEDGSGEGGLDGIVLVSLSACCSGCAGCPTSATRSVG